MSKNDDKILALKKQIDAKREAVGSIKRFSPLTSCSIELDGVRYNLHALDENTLMLLLCKLYPLQSAAESLNLNTRCTISGYPISQWYADVKSRLEIIEQKAELDKLKAMEAQLDKLLSDDKKTELEIDAIASMLGN